MLSTVAGKVIAAAVLAGALVAQESPDGAQINELIEKLKGSSWKEAGGQLKRIGKPAATRLGQALVNGLDEPPETQVWKLRLLDVLMEMQADAVQALPNIERATDRAPVGLLAGLVRAYGEIGAYTDLDADTVDVLEQELAPPRSGRPRQIRVEAERARVRLKMDRRAGMDRIVSWLRMEADPSGPNDDTTKRYRREFALELAAAQGRDAEAAIPVIEPILVEGGADRLVYRKAADAMIAISPHDPRTAGAYVWHLNRSGDPDVRRECAVRLGQYGGGTPAAVNQLLEATRDEHLMVVREAVTSLGIFGPKAVEAIPRLEELTEHDDPQTAARAKAALRQVRDG